MPLPAQTACVNEARGREATAQARGLVPQQSSGFPGKSYPLTQRQGIPSARPQVQCVRWPYLILLTGSWGHSKELLVSRSSGPGTPFYVMLAD